MTIDKEYIHSLAIRSAYKLGDLYIDLYPTFVARLVFSLKKKTKLGHGISWLRYLVRLSPVFYWERFKSHMPFMYTLSMIMVLLPTSSCFIYILGLYRISGLF